MNYFSKNIKYLRQDQQLTQEYLASQIHVSRATLSKYESGKHEPSIEVLVRISRYFNISVDLLITYDISTIDHNKLDELQTDRGIPIPVQNHNAHGRMIEIVSEPAKAGYSGLYSDSEFIANLEYLTIPFLQNQDKCRAFQLDGDSMPPYGHGSYIIARLIHSSQQIQDRKRYIIVSRDEGILFKRVFSLTHENALKLISDNPMYPPFKIKYQDVLEIWEFVAAISQPDASEHYFAHDALKKIDHLSTELNGLSNLLRDSYK